MSPSVLYDGVSPMRVHACGCSEACLRVVNNVGEAIRSVWWGWLSVGIFTGLVNVLALTGSLYMLQVYDRVIPSRSVPTLVGLTILMFALFASHGLLDLVRTRILSRIGANTERLLRDKVMRAVQLLPLRSRQAAESIMPVRDLDQIRAFLSSLGPTALFDIPWMPIYLVLIFLLHPVLGLFATCGALLLVFLTLLTELRTRGPTKEASASAGARQMFGESVRRNAEVIQAMGLGDRMSERWRELSAKNIATNLALTDAANGIGTISKVMRMVLQSGMLGLGAYYTIKGELSAGAIIATSITMSRALAPVEIAIANWRGFVAARQSAKRLNSIMAAMPNEAEVMQLPQPAKSLVVKGLTVGAPGQTTPIIHNVSFQLEAGAGLAVIGASASGKSTLARALVGAWQPMPRGGSVRLDGATLDQWRPAVLGQSIGYLPQDIELFDGTIAENIARMDADAAPEAVIQAAQIAGVHEMIVHLPEGYHTRIGEGGARLSGGQRQRVGLARALYGDPFLVVLDEPNSNLDAIGEFALSHAIKSVRQRGGIVVVVAHRPSVLAGLDQVLAMANGQVQAFGPKDEVLKSVLQPGAAGPPVPQTGARPPGAGQLKIVTDPAKA